MRSPDVHEFPLLHRQLIGWGIFVVGMGLAAFLLIGLLVVGEELVLWIGVAGGSLMALFSVTALRGILATRLVVDSDSVRMHGVGYRVEAPWRQTAFHMDGLGRPKLRLKDPHVSFEGWFGMMMRVGLSSQARSSLHSIPLHSFAAGWPHNPLASTIRRFAPGLMEPSPGTKGRGA